MEGTGILQGGRHFWEVAVATVTKARRHIGSGKPFLTITPLHVIVFYLVLFQSGRLSQPPPLIAIPSLMVYLSTHSIQFVLVL